MTAETAARDVLVPGRRARVHGSVRVVGAGLRGSSIGHALRQQGVDVALADTSPAQLRLAVGQERDLVHADGDDPALARPAAEATLAFYTTVPEEDQQS